MFYSIYGDCPQLCRLRRIFHWNDQPFEPIPGSLFRHNQRAPYGSERTIQGKLSHHHEVLHGLGVHQLFACSQHPDRHGQIECRPRFP